MSRPPEAHFIPSARSAFLRRAAKSPVVGLWRWEEVDETDAWMRDYALVRFGNGRSWIGQLEGDSFSALRRSLGRMPVQKGIEASTCAVKRLPRPTLLNAYLLVILVMLVGAIWGAFFDGKAEPGLFLAVGLPVGFMWVVALLAMGSWRSRLELRDGRLKVFEGRNPEPIHDLARTELGDLWLRELYHTEQKAALNRGTANTLHLMARTHDGQVHALVCLRSGVLTCRNRNAVLGWMERVLGRNGVGPCPDGPHRPPLHTGGSQEAVERASHE